MSLEDELKLQEANQKILNLMSELNESKEKISEIMTQFNEAKNKEIMFSGEVRSLQAEIKYMEANKKNIDILNDRIGFLEKERKNLEEQISNLEKKLEEKETKIEQLSQDKENLLEEKSQILEGKNETLQKMTEKELDLQKKDQEIADLRSKFKRTSSELLSKTMEIDKLVKKVKALEEVEGKSISKTEEDTQLKEKISQLEMELEKKAEKDKILQETVVISNLNQVMEQIKVILPQGRSTIRLVLPNINDLNKYGISEIIKAIPSNVIINVAVKIDDPFGDTYVKEIKRFCQLTNYSDKKFIAINVDSSKFLIGIFKENEIIGIYTELPDFIDLFKQAIMEPFIKGKKIF